MDPTKLGMALLAALAVGAVMTSSALAAATTPDVQWYTAASPGTLLSGSESTTASGKTPLLSEVAGTPLEIEFELDCIGCTIKNEGERDC